MNSHRASEDEIFEKARQLPAEERAAYLKEATAGNDPLRQRIEKLIRVAENAGDFLKQPAAEAAGTLVITAGLVPLTEKPGDKIGRYKLREKIGEGGCGVVYVADQEEPVRRRVALKVIKLGMDTKQVVARFEAERQALALMDHPNIAKVLDAGATDTGRPYFVMELVRGIRITDYCDQNNLSTEERLKLFIQVCSAIQHAHQKGIIHRDIKPSNVLVTVNDNVPVPKVIDFGIAKATTDQRLTDKTVYTAFEQFLGTPAYMSPEQAVMTSLDIDTRSDIYALGVLLYELLTGETPFDAQTLLQAGLEKMRRMIQEQEPPRPSTRLGTLTKAELTAVASHRRAEPPKLISLISGDLDWIVMKALEKDRTRRFETVNALAMDVQRHLDDEPVVACPPSFAYRFEKMVRRNKAAFAVSTAVILIVVIGLSVSFYLMHKEKAALKRALLAETAQRRSAQEAEANELVYQAAEDLIGLNSVFGGPDEETYMRLPQAESRLRKAVGIRTGLFGRNHPSVLAALKKLAEVLTYRKYPVEIRDETANMLREVVKMEKAIKGDEHPDVAESLDRLAEYLDRAASPPKAAVVAAYRESLAIRRKHPGEENGDLFNSTLHLASLLQSEDKLPEAESLYRECIDWRRSHSLKQSRNLHYPDIGSVRDCLFEVLRNEGKLADAETICRERVSYWKDVTSQGKATALWNLADVVRAQGRLDESKLIEGEALAIWKQLLAGNENTSWYIGCLAKDFVYRHQPGEAERIFDEVLSLKPPPKHEVNLLRERADIRANLRLFKEAADDFKQMLNLSSDGRASSAYLAILLNELGDTAGSRQCLEKMLEGGFEKLSLYQLIRITRTPLLLPTPGNNPTIITAMTDRLLESFTDLGGYSFIQIDQMGSSWNDSEQPGGVCQIHTIKGLAEYRRGNFNEARAFAEKSLFYDTQPISYAVLAMAQHQQGKFGDARTNLAKAFELERSVPDQSWDEKLSTQILLREAQSLIESKPATPESAK